MKFLFEVKTAEVFAKYGKKALQLAVIEAYNKHDRGEKITRMERVLCGLLFSEFFASTTSEEDLFVATEIQQVMYTIIGINDYMKFRGEVYKMAGWDSAKYYK